MTTITFTADHSRADAHTGTICLGEGSPSVSYGLGWTETARPKREGFMNWEGRSLLRQKIPVLLDGFSTGQSVQPLYDFLEGLAHSTGGPPPVLQLRGPIHHSEFKWVIESLEWDEDAQRHESGALARQGATLTFAEYEAPDIARRLRKGPRTYKVKRGDTLQKIAAKQLGSSKRWQEIYKRNRRKIKDPRKLKVGLELTLPDL